MKFAGFVCFEATIAELASQRRDEVIAELVEALAGCGRLGKTSAEEITKAVIKRENEASTGMGKGVAVPHVKHDAIKKMTAAVGRSSKGIDFSSLDKQPVYSVILLISPSDDPDTHLQAMENIYKHLLQEKFRKFLRQSQNKEQIEELLKEADEGSFIV